MSATQTFFALQETTSADPLHPQGNLESDDTETGQDKPRAPGKDEAVILEQVENHPYELSYTCLLLPRVSSDELAGDIIAELQAWLKQICVSFGWHLEFLSIQPKFMQWTMRVPPTASTAHFMQVIREHTSRHIFAEFPQYKNNTSSSDFWAPGYLIVWGSQLHPPEIIQRYIQQTRQQQGHPPDE